MFSFGVSGRAILSVVLLFLSSLTGVSAAASSRLDEIRHRGSLNCGLEGRSQGFSVIQNERMASGLEVDICRGVAESIFGDPSRARFIRVKTVDEFIQGQQLDLVLHRLTRKPERERRWGVRFGETYFQDGQAIAVRYGRGDSRDLAGKRVCVEERTPFSQVIVRSRPDIIPVFYRTANAARLAFISGGCEGWTWDASSLASALAGPKARQYAILPDRFSSEPLAPIVRAGDDSLLNVVNEGIRLSFIRRPAQAKALNIAFKPIGCTFLNEQQCDMDIIYNRNLTGLNRVRYICNTSASAPECSSSFLSLARANVAH